MKLSTATSIIVAAIILTVIITVFSQVIKRCPPPPDATASQNAMNYIEGRQASDDTIYLEYNGTKVGFLKISSIEDPSPIALRGIPEKEFRNYLKKMLIEDNWVILTNENCKFGEEKTQTKVLAVSRHFPPESIPKLLRTTGFLPATSTTTQPTTKPSN